MAGKVGPVAPGEYSLRSSDVYNRVQNISELCGQTARHHRTVPKQIVGFGDIPGVSSQLSALFSFLNFHSFLSSHLSPCLHFHSQYRRLNLSLRPRRLPVSTDRGLLPATKFAALPFTPLRAILARRPPRATATLHGSLGSLKLSTQSIAESIRSKWYTSLRRENSRRFDDSSRGVVLCINFGRYLHEGIDRANRVIQI